MMSATRRTETFSLLLIVLASIICSADTLKCYVCNSWEHQGCTDDSYVDERYYEECNIRTALVPIPVYCLKEITTFKDLSNTHAKYHQAHVVRRCTSIPANKAYRTNGLKLEAYEDGCERHNVVVNSITGERKICSCATDACNSSQSQFLGTFALKTMLLGLSVLTLMSCYMNSFYI